MLEEFRTVRGSLEECVPPEGFYKVKDRLVENHTPSHAGRHGGGYLLLNFAWVLGALARTPGISYSGAAGGGGRHGMPTGQTSIYIYIYGAGRPRYSAGS